MNPSPAALELLDVFLGASTGALSAAAKLKFATDVDRLMTMDGVPVQEVREMVLRCAAEGRDPDTLAKAARSVQIRAWWQDR